MATDKQTSQRLLRVYGIDLDQYNLMLAEQGGKCAICGRPPGDKRLHVDHCHKFVRRKIAAIKVSSGKWTASTDPFETPYFEGTGATKSEAKQAVKRLLITNANRGLLCWGCNAGLAKWRDNPDNMSAAAEYLRKFQQKINQPKELKEQQ